MKKIIKFYKNLTFAQGAVFTVTLSSVIAIAAPITGIHVFSAGQTISSADVNDNFNILKTTVEGMSSGQTYVGTYDASVNTPPPTGSAPGEYYIITVMGNYGGDTYAVGDWTMWDGSAWDKVPNSAPVATVFGRLGVITATEADYTLNLLGDVNLTSPTPTSGKVLTYDGTQWRAAPVPSDPTVEAFAKMSLPSCAGGEVLKSNGTNFSCVTDNTGVPFTGTPNVVVTTNGSGLLTSSSVTPTELGHLSGATSNLQTQINNKANAASFIDWMTTGVQTIHPSRINLTTASKMVATDATGFVIASGINSSDLTGLTGAVQTQLNGKASNLAGTFSTSATSPFFQISSNGAANSTAFRGSTAGAGMFFPSSTTVALSSNGTQTLTVDSGNVGIFNSAPTSRLEIGTTAEASNFATINASNSGRAGFIANSNGSATIQMVTNFGSPYQGIPTGAAGVLVGNSFPMVFAINSAEKMRITPSGYVGIGVASPTVALDVSGDILTSGHVKTQFVRTTIAGSASSPNISYLTDPGTGVFLPGGSAIGFTNNGTEAMRLTSSGNLGIGTSSPTEKLHVIGNILASGTVTQSSDRRLKKNITPISNALEKLLGLRGVEFDWRNNDVHDTGVIAQEVEAKFPNLVVTDKDGMKAVKYSNMAGVFIEASKDLNKKIVKLESENKMLKNYLCTRDPMAPFCEQ